MCGIAGLFASDLTRDIRSPLERLTTALSHRGPDGSGYRYFGLARGFGHRRLSIVDIEGGTQPMTNEDGRVWVVFNGEIYNHVALRVELEGLGHRFRTRADTEVLVHGWEEWGTNLFGRLNGIFAFAVYDGRNSEEGFVWLVRDPVGVKPLYLGGDARAWWFASELQAVRRAGLAESEIRPEAVAEYLVYRFVPSPGTPFTRTWKVPAGHYCRVDLRASLGAPHFEPYAYRPTAAPEPRTAREWMEALRDAIWQAVERQLMADVPLGTLLSGGVDSTLVTRIMVSRQSLSPLAFAIGFEGAPLGGELRLARNAAVALDVPLIEAAVTTDEFLSAWPAQIAAMSEPVANAGVLLVGLLCRAVRGERKVVLTGQGADEPLGGYPRHVAERFYRVARPLRQALTMFPDHWGSSDQWRRLRRMLSARGAPERFAELLAVFSPVEATALTRGQIETEALVAPVHRCMAPETDDSMNQLLQVDRRLSLSDDLLLVMDQMSMASSVEARVPFLDLELLSLVERMPSRFKVSRLGERKWLYRRAVGPDLPSEVRGPLTGWAARVGTKWGFTTPLGAWYEAWTRSHATSYLTGPAALLPTYLARESVNAFLSKAGRDPRRHQRQLLSLYVLETWLRGMAQQIPSEGSIPGGAALDGRSVA